MGQAIDKLKPEQVDLLERVLRGETYKQIASDLGIHINTLYKRKERPEFQEALKEAQRAGIMQAQAVFTNKAAWAAKKIVEMVDDPEATRVQFQAACKVYDSAVGITVEEFEDRIIALEESITREV